MAIELLPRGTLDPVGTEGVRMTITESGIITSGRVGTTPSRLNTNTSVHEPMSGLWTPGRIYTSRTVCDISRSLLGDPTSASTEKHDETEYNGFHTEHGTTVEDWCQCPYLTNG